MKSTNCFFHRLAIALMVLVLAAVAFSSCGTVRQLQSSILPTADFFRVDNFPSGDQIAAVAAGGKLVSGLFAGKAIENTYQAPYDKVWNAARRAAMRLDVLSRKKIEGSTLSYRQVVALDQNTGVIQIGKIEDPGDMGRLRGIGVTRERHMWSDEFHLKIESLSPTQSKVNVLRKVVVGVPDVIDQFGTSFRDKLQEKASSGNYERWLLTQIEDDLTGKLKRESIAIIQLKLSEDPNATFLYTPRKGSTTSSFNLGLLKYSFTVDGAEQLKNLTSESSSFVQRLLTSYRDSLQLNLDRIIAAQGFRTTGVFENVEQMTYPQRQSSPLVLVHRTKLTIRESYGNNSVIQGQIIKNTIQDSISPTIFKGKLSVGGQFLLELYEPFSREKMWNKSINIPFNEVEFTYKATFPGEEYFGGDFDLKYVVYGEDTRAKLLGQILTSGFTKVLDEAFDSLKPNDLKQIFDLANDLRSKRKY